MVRDNLQSRGQRLTLRDAETLWQITPLLKSATPLVEGYVSLFGPAASRPTRLIGVTADYKDILRLSVTKGRFLSKLDDRALARVCVLGRRIASDLFGFREPVGESVRVAGKWYRVVGVLGERSMAGAGSGALATRDLNEAVLVPLSTLLAQPLHADPSTPVHEIWLHLSRGDRVIPVGRVVEEILARLHGGRDDFEVVVPRALMNQRLRTQRTFSVVVGSMASLTLLVGGIGIMNIMLASVLERTGEIGLRRTVGATKRDITMQFLVEALLLTSTGGAFGIALGITISLGISAYAGWPTSHLSSSRSARVFHVFRYRTCVRHLPRRPGRAFGAHRRDEIRVNLAPFMVRHRHPDDLLTGSSGLDDFELGSSQQNRFPGTSLSRTFF